MTAFFFRNRDPSVRRTPRGKCIYCGSVRYREKDERKLGDEHVVPESLGGTLVLEQAACEACERTVNEFEQPILKSVLYAPRVHLGIRRKKRKRGEEVIKLQGRVNGKDIDVFLPIKRAPIMLFFVRLGPPGILVGRPSHVADVPGAWVIHLAGQIVPPGFQSIASPVLDTFKFSQFLAKIAHCFAVDQLGDNFTPLLPAVIRQPASSQQYSLIGGEPNPSPASENLHELHLEWHRYGETDYATVRIRLFANLGAPTYWVVAGGSKTS